MIRIEAKSRLHFGFLNAAAPPGQRRFGGVGLMVNDPALSLVVEPAKDWSAAGPLAERAVEFARQFAASVPADLVKPQRIVIEKAPPVHAGLGSGTQLALAVARALNRAWELPALPAVELARRVGRGRRSALGIHGFEQGGFLVEAGKLEPAEISPLVARLPFPEDWRVLVVIPANPDAMHGHREADALARLPHDDRTTERLCRLVLVGMLPALAARDLAAFSEALFDFNRLVGEQFSPVQGGPFAPSSAPIVRCLRSAGIRGVAQSSWGPTVAAVGEQERLDALLPRLREELELVDTPIITTASN
ncbi:MAG: beta-ribofuranosylaminobenzene 5'-phosphate synthase family protein [Gemmataceae bacterium]